MILEWVAEGAVQRNPGLVVRGVDDLRLFKGVILSGREPATVEIAAGKAVRDGDEFRVPVELRGTLANGREVIHARAEVVLGDRHADRHAAARRSVAAPATRCRAMRSIGASCSTARRCRGSSGSRAAASAGSRAGSRPSPPPSEWVERPLRSRG